MGYTLEAQHRKLAALDRRPDLLIAYCGHNEFASRHHPARVIDYYVDSCRRTAWGILVEWAEDLLHLRSDPGDGRQVPPGDPDAAGPRSLGRRAGLHAGEFRGLLADFHRRLETIASMRSGSVPSWC